MDVSELAVKSRVAGRLLGLIYWSYAVDVEEICVTSCDMSNDLVRPWQQT